MGEPLFAVAGRVIPASCYVDCPSCKQQGHINPLWCPVCMNFINVGERIICVSTKDRFNRTRHEHYHYGACYNAHLKRERLRED